MIFKQKISSYQTLLFLFLSGFLFSQQSSGREYRRTGIHNGNLVRTVFGNWGVVGQPGSKGPRGAWINDNNGYIGDVSPIIGVEVSANDTSGNPLTFHSVVVTPADRPNLGGFEESPTGKFWGFEPVSGYLNETQERVAISTDPNTWPPYWPDKLNESDDSGWSGKWNGYFGKDIQNIQQESYFLMDDNNDEEFNHSQYNNLGVAFHPDSLNLSRNGLGLKMAVRGMQWQQFLAQDCIFWVYEVKNESTTDYKKAVFGMLVGTYIGVTSTEDRGEYDDDWSFFDVNDDITYTGDFDNDVSRNPKWDGDVGMVGYAFLESPGNPFDGIDNDGDYQELEGAPFAPLFEESNFDSTLINVGQIVILIDSDYLRTEYTIPDLDTVEVITGGEKILIIPGETYLSEGNPIELSNNIEGANINAFDGIDNDLDGLIDENYFLHYRQRRVDQNGTILFDIINPRAYIDYISGLGIDNPLIDEARDDNIDNDGDWDMEYDDIGADGIPDTQDIGENDGQPTHGEPNFDETDVDESDQIGLTSFDYFTPAGDYPMKHDEQLWEKLKPGFFDTPSSIQNGVPIAGEDGDFIYGSGFFPLRAGQTERFSVALVYGKDLEELINNKRTVQNIYNNNYRSPPPPIKPTLTAVPGDEKITLYWDRVSESSVDPITKVKDFQGYKLYRATDYNFNDVRNVTNAHGIIEGYSPIAQFDLDDEIEGYFYPSNILFQETQGYSYYLGGNSGLVHSFIDEDVDNGRNYYYSIVAYDRGESDIDIFPAENSKFITVLPSGEIFTDKNTAVITPTSQTAGYSLNDSILISAGNQNIGTGQISIEIMDEQNLTGFAYLIDFLDTVTDSIDNDGDWTIDDDANGNGVPDKGENNIDYLDEQEFPAITSYYNVQTVTPTQFIFTPEDTLYTVFPHKNILNDSYFSLKNSHGVEIDFDDYYIDFENGKLRATNLESLGNDEHTLIYNYYPIYKNPYIHNTIWTNPSETPYVPEAIDSDIFDGLRIHFNNDWTIQAVDSLTYWWTTENEASWKKNDGDSTYFFTVGTQDFPSLNLYAQKSPSDYVIVFSDDLAFGLSDNYPLPSPGNPTNFRVFNQTSNETVNYMFVDGGRTGILDNLDILYFFEKDSNDIYHYTWSVTFTLRQSHADSLTFNYGDGDSLFISMVKPFRKGDTFTFTAPQPQIDETLAKNNINNVRVVPNPYFSAHEFESPLPPGIVSGRGERKIFFKNVPNDAFIHIYSSRGQHINTLNPNENMFDGTITWNLKTKENLNIAYGVYFYVVESEMGGQSSGKFAVIK
mgnify:FL=1